MNNTTAIKNGKLKATDIEVGDSVTGVLTDFVENKYGKLNIVLDVNGKPVEVFVAGNLRFLADDVANGKKALGLTTTITRVDDKEINGYKTSQFQITQGAASAAASTAAAPASSLKDRIAQMKNKASGANS